MIKINLAPPAARKRFTMPGFNLGILFGILFVALVAVLGFWWWALDAEVQDLTRQVSENEKEIVRLKQVIAEGQRFKREKEELELRVNAIESVARLQARPVYLLDAVADMLPKDLWLTRMEEKGHQLRFAGTTYPGAISSTRREPKLSTAQVA